jgi:16S rRNA processing protein RimM
VTARRGSTRPQPSDPTDPERLTVGLVRGLHGLRGAVRIEVLSDDPSRFEVGSVLHPDGSSDALTVSWMQSDGPGILVRFRERPTRESVEDLRDRYLEARVTEALSDDRVYWHELDGVAVMTTSGEELGRVADIFRAGGAEVLVVRGGRRGEVLVPVVAAIIPEFAPRDGRIVVDPAALDLEDGAAERKPRGRRTRRAHAGSSPGTSPPSESSPSESSATDDPSG